MGLVWWIPSGCLVSVVSLTCLLIISVSSVIKKQKPLKLGGLYLLPAPGAEGIVGNYVNLFLLAY